MRIFIPAYSFKDCFADNVQMTLTAMGHEVSTLGFVNYKRYWSLPRYALRVTIEMIAGDRPTLKDYKILKFAREFKPDMVLSVTGHLHPIVLQELGAIVPGRRVLWWGDPLANSQKWGILDPGWDFVYVKDLIAVKKLRLAGRNAYLLHEAMNPHWHKPLASQNNRAVVVAGNYYAFRQVIVLRLLEDGVAVQLYGPPPPRWAASKIKQHHTGRYIVGEEKSRVFGEGMACLNTFSLSEGDSLNCRAFEIAGAAGLQLIEYRRAIEDCFEPNKELLVFNSYEELLECVQRIEKNPQGMESVRHAGARRALAEHTYRHRLEVILGNL